MRRSRLATGLLLAASFGVGADPLYSRNLSPLAGLIGFPPLRAARVLERGHTVMELHASAANTQTSDSNASDTVVLDGETWRLAPRLRYGLGAGWELEAELPWLRHGAGEMDKLIENWHALWGLPDGQRDEMPRDRLFYGYRGAGTAFVHADTAAGVGDASVGLVREVWRHARAALSLRGQLTFASGDEDKWLGSGSQDYSLGVVFSAVPAPQSDWQWHAQLGYTRAGKIGWLGGIQQRNLWFGGLGAQWRVRDTLHLKLQVEAHAAPADSSLKPIGEPAVLLCAGLSWAPVARWELDFSVSEDIAVDTAADVVFQFGLRYR